MKALTFLFLLLSSQVWAEQVFEGDVPVTLKALDGNHLVSCDVIKHRLQEYAKRNAEEDYLIKWYSPVIKTVGQSEALLNILNRMPDFVSDRIYENVEASYYWITGEEVVDDLKHSPFIYSQVYTGKYQWRDPYKGELPPGVSMDYGNIVVVFRQKLSMERFCLEPSVDLKISTDKGTYVFKARPEPGLKDI